MQMIQSILDVLPPDYREAVRGCNWAAMQEIRLRIGQPLSIRTACGEQMLPAYSGKCTEEALEYVLRAGTSHSIYSVEKALGEGYFTLPGGHRVGVCGTVVRHGEQQTMKEITSLNIRIAHDIWIEPGRLEASLQDSLLIIGPPGSGKTTLLRACIRALSRKEFCVGVVDERGELAAFALGEHVDVLRGCGKQAGMERLLRSMNPAWIALDEISAEEDVRAVERTAYCGVKLLATAHASGVDELNKRGVYRQLIGSGVFPAALVLGRGWSFSEERLV